MVVCQVVVNILVSVRKLWLEKHREADGQLKMTMRGEIGWEKVAFFVVAWQKLRWLGNFKRNRAKSGPLLCNGEPIETRQF